MEDCHKHLKLLQTLKIEDRKYELWERGCDNCNLVYHEVWRWSGASFSRYAMPPYFSETDFDDFVEGVDDALLVTAADAIKDFHRSLAEVNSSAGIQADESFAFRLLEYGRHRASTLQKLGMLNALIRDGEPRNDSEMAVRAAFELGMAATEHKLLDVYEDYLYAGFALEEWRQSGLPKARAERIRQGKKTRSAIQSAAECLYAEDPWLRRNDSETARRILGLRLPELQKGTSGQLGTDAVTRHLRALRKRGSGSGKFL